MATNLDATSNNNDRSPADGWANIMLTVNGKPIQLGKNGTALDKSRPLDALILELAESDPDAIANLDVSLRVVITDQSVAKAPMTLASLGTK